MFLEMEAAIFMIFRDCFTRTENSLFMNSEETEDSSDGSNGVTAGVRNSYCTLPFFSCMNLLVILSIPVGLQE